MLRLTRDANGLVLAEVQGFLEPPDVERLREALRESIGAERRGRALLALRELDVEEFDATDIWLEVKRAVFLKGMTHLAVVTDAERVPDFGRFTFLAPFPTKVFPAEEQHAAIAWLTEASARSRAIG